SGGGAQDQALIPGPAGNVRPSHLPGDIGDLDDLLIFIRAVGNARAGLRLEGLFGSLLRGAGCHQNRRSYPDRACHASNDTAGADSASRANGSPAKSTSRCCASFKIPRIMLRSEIAPSRSRLSAESDDLQVLPQPTGSGLPRVHFRKAPRRQKRLGPSGLVRVVHFEGYGATGYPKSVLAKSKSGYTIT